MGHFEVIDHTSEVGILAYASSLPELFEVAAAGMFSLIVDPVAIENRVWLERRTDADDREGLLVAWLNSLLAMMSGEGFVPKAFVVDEVSDTYLRATVHGEPVDPERHRFRMDVKAATYHMLEVKQVVGGWTARVIFDV